MNTAEFFDNMSATLAYALELCKKKKKDYDSEETPFKNFNGYALIGVAPERGILLQVQNKVMRIGNLLDSKDIQNEPLEDSIVDAIVYLCNLKAYMDDKRSKNVLNNINSTL